MLVALLSLSGHGKLSIGEGKGGREEGGRRSELCPFACLSLWIRIFKRLRGCLHKCVCTSVLLFLPDKVCIFPVSNSETGWEAFLNPSQHFFEFPGSVPMVGGPFPERSLPCFSPFCSGSSVSPALFCHCCQLVCLLFIQEAPGGERCLRLKSKELFAIAEPLFTSHRVSHNRGLRNYLKWAHGE